MLNTVSFINIHSVWLTLHSTQSDDSIFWVTIIINTVLHYTPVPLLGIGIARGQQYWVLSGLLGIILTLEHSHVFSMRYLRYSTSHGERESWPFHEQPETSVSILISTAVLQLDFFVLCIQHCRHVHSHWSGVFNMLKFDPTPKKKKNWAILEVLLTVI